MLGVFSSEAVKAAEDISEQANDFQNNL
jgi:hypothetical protein